MNQYKRAQAVLRFITGYHEAHGYCPSYGEIATGTGRTAISKASVQRDLILLERRGAIRRLPDRARAIEVLKPVAVPRGPSGEPLYFVRPAV